MRRLQGDGDRQRLLAGRQPLALIHIEQRHSADQCTVGPARGTQYGIRRHGGVNEEREVASDRLERRQIRRGLATTLGLSDRVEVKLERTGERMQLSVASHASTLPEGFKVEDMQAFKRDVEQIAADNPRLAPAPVGTGAEGKKLADLFRRSCPLGQHQMADCDGILPWPAPFFGVH